MRRSAGLLAGACAGVAVAGILELIGGGILGSADAQGTPTATARLERELKGTDKRVIAAIKRANRNRADIAALRARGTGVGTEGPAGPAGPQGPKGDTGAQGSPGLAGVVEVLGDVRSIDDDSGGLVHRAAVCPAGKTPISGGVFQTLSTGPANGAMIAVPPAQALRFKGDGREDDGWTVAVSNDTGATRFFRVYAVCATVAG